MIFVRFLASPPLPSPLLSFPVPWAAMAGTARILPAAAAALLLLLCIAGGARAANVTYDHRALVIDGVRRVLVSGSIHYPRSTPDVGILPLSFSITPRPLPPSECTY